jgi:hypothetical protein
MYVDACIGNLPPGVRIQTDLTAIYLTPPPLTSPQGCSESTHARVYGPTPKYYIFVSATTLFTIVA